MTNIFKFFRLGVCLMSSVWTSFAAISCNEDPLALNQITPVVSPLTQSVEGADTDARIIVEFQASVINPSQNYYLEVILNEDSRCNYGTCFTITNDVKPGAEFTYLVPVVRGMKRGALMISPINAEIDYTLNLHVERPADDSFIFTEGKNEIKVTILDR